MEIIDNSANFVREPEIEETPTHQPFTPINDFILVDLIEDKNDLTKEGFYRPDRFRQPSNRGTVIALGHLVTAPVQVSDIITFGRANSEELEIDDKPFLLIRSNDVRGVEKAI